MKLKNFPGRKWARIQRMNGLEVPPEIKDMSFKIGGKNRDSNGRAKNPELLKR